MNKEEKPRYRMRPLTPVERAIDKACGTVAAGGMAHVFIRLHCPSCGRTQETYALESDPEGATEVVVECPECASESEI